MPDFSSEDSGGPEPPGGVIEALSDEEEVFLIKKKKARSARIKSDDRKLNTKDRIDMYTNSTEPGTDSTTIDPIQIPPQSIHMGALSLKSPKYMHSKESSPPATPNTEKKTENLDDDVYSPRKEEKPQGTIPPEKINKNHSQKLLQKVKEKENQSESIKNATEDQQREEKKDLSLFLDSKIPQVTESTSSVQAANSGSYYGVQKLNKVGFSTEKPVDILAMIPPSPGGKIIVKNTLSGPPKGILKKSGTRENQSISKPKRLKKRANWNWKLKQTKFPTKTISGVTYVKNPYYNIKEVELREFLDNLMKNSLERGSPDASFVLDLSSRELTYLPAIVSKQTYLTVLNLYMNQLKYLPFDIGLSPPPPFFSSSLFFPSFFLLSIPIY